jgi:excisionase family DNA binding protein
MEPLAISVNHAAKALGVGRSSIYGLMKEGRIEAFKVGRRTLLTTASINRLASGEGLRPAGEAPANPVRDS